MQAFHRLEVFAPVFEPYLALHYMQRSQDELRQIDPTSGEGSELPRKCWHIGIVAIQRTFLDPATAMKAAFFKPKRALGQLGASARSSMEVSVWNCQAGRRRGWIGTKRKAALPRLSAIRRGCFFHAYQP